MRVWSSIVLGLYRLFVILLFHWSTSSFLHLDSAIFIRYCVLCGQGKQLSKFSYFRVRQLGSLTSPYLKCAIESRKTSVTCRLTITSKWAHCSRSRSSCLIHFFLYELACVLNFFFFCLFGAVDLTFDIFVA